MLGVDTEVSIREVARGAGISPFHFIRQFDAVFGVTPHRFRTQRRLERARELLAAGHSVTETCFSVGFSSLGSFSDLFTRTIGTTPSGYRRRLVQVLQAAPMLIPGCLGLMTGLPRDAFRNSREARVANTRHSPITR